MLRNPLILAKRILQGVLLCILLFVFIEGVLMRLQ